MITTGLYPNQLNEEEKSWFAIAICGAIIADGNVAHEELLYLEKALSFLPSTEKVSKLIQAVKDQKLPDLPPLKVGLRETHTKMLFELTLVISSDNSLTSREMAFLFQAGKKLGFEKEMVQAAIRWAHEGMLWRIKLKHLLKTGSELETEYG